MNIKICARPLSHNLPLCRVQLYEDVVCSGKYGSIQRVWLSPGHVFISVNGGSHLFTFDTKPANRISEENKGCLDLQGLNPPVCEVLVPGTNYSLVYVVQCNGLVQCWKFRTDYTWILLQQFEICNINKAEIISICLQSSHNALYWCEKCPTGNGDNLTYCICKRQLQDDEDKIKLKNNGPVVAILHNCPPSIVYPTMSGLAVFIKNEEPLVSMVIVWKVGSSKISVFMGKYHQEVEVGPQQTADFKSIAFNLIPVTIKLTQSEMLKGVLYNSHTVSVRMVENEGIIRKILDRKGKGLCKLKLDSESEPAIHLDIDKESVTMDTVWFDFQGIIGALTDSSIRFYRSSTGQYIGHLDSPDGSQIQGFCTISSGMIFHAFYTEQNIYVFERKKITEKESIGSMLSTKQFQTQAVHLSYLEQQKSQNPTPETFKKIMELRQAWELESDKLPSSKLAEILYPYLKQYWKLEELQQENLHQKLLFPTLCPGDIEDEILRILNPETNITMSARHSWLLILADEFPQQVLTILMSQLEFETDDISTSQLQRWQCILAQDCVDSPVSSDVAVPMFEHICRLLFKIQPSRLVKFVKIAHLINDQRVGVSAFIRKRQALQYYDRALECLPDIGSSSCFDDAITAHVQLLLASEQDDCEMTALNLYLKHNQWTKAIELLKEYVTSQQYYKLFLTALTIMSDKKVLSQYVDELFSLMPELKSFSVLSSVLRDTESEDQEDNVSAKSVFVQNPQDIRLDSIRPYLLKKISQKSKNS